jgi:hypothetical protein
MVLRMQPGRERMLCEQSILIFFNNFEFFVCKCVYDAQRIVHKLGVGGGGDIMSLIWTLFNCTYRLVIHW